MDEICSEGELDNLQPICNAISKVRTLEPVYYEEIDDLLILMDKICSEGEPDNLQPVCNAISNTAFTLCSWRPGSPDCSKGKMKKIQGQGKVREF